MLVAPVVAQLSLVLEPELMLVGLAVKELIVGVAAAVTVTVAMAVVEPEGLVAASVYVVVAVGLTLTEPLAEPELNPPGEIEIVAAPLVVQLSVQLAPEFMLVGFAAKDPIEGLESVPVGEFGELAVPAQFVRPTQTARMRTKAQTRGLEERRPRKSRILRQRRLAESKPDRVVMTRKIVQPTV
jgi:hypothetical protein